MFSRGVCSYRKIAKLLPSTIRRSHTTSPTFRFTQVRLYSKRTSTYKYDAPKGVYGKSTENLKAPPSIIKISDEVQDALRLGNPVVALESTIYTHGFPYPDNVALALDLEQIARKHGVIPATIGILDGVATVGLNEEELRRLASSAGKPETMKVSRRDIPFILGMVGSFTSHDSTVS